MFQLPLDVTDPASPVGQRFVSLHEGTRIGGRFRLAQLLERGTELAIFDGHDEQTGHEVLVRFRPSAARVDSRLNHPGIAQYLDQGCIGSWYAAVLDPGEGESLAQALRQLGTDHVLAERLVVLGVDLLQSLEHAHLHGLCHGNLGIHSLHLTPEWGAVVLDFPEELTVLRDEALPFASPERLSGDRGDERSDVYAVASLLYSLGAGQPPFGLSPHQARDGHLYQPLPPHPNLSRPLFEVLQTAMAKQPDARYPTAAAFSAALIDAYQRVRNPGRVEDASPPVALPVVGDLDRPDTLDPAPVRAAAPSAEFSEEPGSSSLASALSFLLLGLLCAVVAALAGSSLLAAGGLWWVTSMGPVAPSSVQVAAAQPLLTMPDARVATEAPIEPTFTDSTPVRPVLEPVPVHFGYDSWQAEPEPGFDAFITAANAHEGRVRLTGHTDNRGTAEANRLMGLGRAWSVGLLMAVRGFDEGRIELISDGEEHPIADNSTEAGRSRNRRVTAEFVQERRVSDLLIRVD